MRITALSERGDTIVEVLIAIAIVGVMLVGAYATTNRSLLETRDTQERSDALKLAEGQIEQLKSALVTSPSVISGAPASFCMTSATAVADSTNSACRVSSGGSPTTSEPAYNLAITSTTDANGFTTYTVQNTWNSVRGTGQSQVQMTYRVYP